jgi:hypothetical protein
MPLHFWIMLSIAVPSALLITAIVADLHVTARRLDSTGTGFGGGSR